MADISEGLPRGERSGSASKRKRVAIACVTCRARKARCDGRQPCSSCTSMGFQCIFSQSESSSNLIVGREYMSDLENRVRSLEHAFGDLQTTRSLSQAGSSPAASGPMLTATSQTGGNVSMADELFLITAPSQIFFGPSSTIAFTKSVFAIIESTSSTYPLGLARAMEPPVYSTTFVGENEQLSGTTTPSSSLSNMFNDQSRELLIRYFDNFGSLVPIIHRPSFLERFESARYGDSRMSDKSWLALLNIMLAVSVLDVSGSLAPSQDYIRQAAAYQETAHQVLLESSLHDLNLSLVRCRLLTSCYFHIRRDLVQAWDQCNAAVQGAMHLGLHSSRDMHIVNPTDEAERKKTWLAIGQVYRNLCIMFGRPCPIPKESDAARSEQEAEEVVAPEIQASRVDVLSEMFFNASSTLSGISGAVVERLYGNNASHLSNVDASSALQGMLNMDKRMSDWISRLSSSLSLISSRDMLAFQYRTQEVDFSQRLRILLSLRYLNARLLLYRPLCSSASPEVNAGVTNLEHAFVKQLQADVLGRAYETSAEIIEMVYALSVAPTGQKILFTERAISVHYVFNAALMVLLVLVAHLTPGHAFAGKIEAAAAASCLDHAITGLDWLNQGVPSSVQTSFLKNALAAIAHMNPGGDAALYSGSGETSSVLASNQPYFQPENFTVYEEPANIYRDLDLEGFLGST